MSGGFSFGTKASSGSGAFTFGEGTSFGGASTGASSGEASNGFGFGKVGGSGIGSGGGNNLFGQGTQAAFGAKPSPSKGDATAGGGATEDDQVDTTALKLPEIHGKLKEVDVKSGEEDEETLITVRSKLYVFYETDKYGDEIRKNLWKSRGTGDVKILKHRQTGKCRLLMRQDKVKKICANVLLPVDATLKPQGGTKNSMTTFLPDFDGETTEVRTFAFKFKTDEIAASFKEAFDKGVQINATGGDSSSAEPPKAAPFAPVAAATTTAPPPKAKPVPTFSELGSIYGENNPNLRATTLRYKNLCARFRALYQQEPDFIVRAPGRANIIGEHIDYMGYSVMPFALENDTLIAGSTAASSGQTSTVELNHVDDRQFPGTKFAANSKLNVDVSSGVNWYNYFQCGYRGMFDEAAETSGSAPPAKDMKVLVHTTVPLGSGLSSSSSFVVASLLASAQAHGVTFDQSQVGTRSQKCEGYIGTMGGGMDQAISVMGERGMAKHVEFDPLQTSDVRLPSDGCFVVANSLAVSAKAVTADKQYNMRVTECKLGALLVAKELNVSFQLGESVTYRLLAEKHLKLSSPITIAQLQEMETLCRSKLHEAPFTQAEIEKALGGGAVKILNDKRCNNVFNVNKEFFLHQRAGHVYSEARRVLQFKAECAKPAYPGQLKALGDLMNESGASCATDYDCSCPELDAITSLALKSGAVGSRLTGAGWGGSTVSLVHSKDVDSFIKALQAGYFDGNENAKNISNKKSYLFSSAPSQGAAVVKVDKFLSIDDVNVEDLI
jgi:N-acetylgalactosamine kinase